MNKRTILKTILPHIIAILAFIIVSSIYFYPAWEGKSIQKHDSIEGRGKVREKNHYRKYEKETVLWNNTIFSGMPEFVYAPYKGASSLNQIYNFPRKMGLPREISVLFWYMLGFYILLICLRTDPWLAIGGAIAFGLTTYNLAIINAGHYTKVYTISLIPPTLGGILLVFRKKYIAGFILTAIFLAMQINMAHFQMTYYFGIAVIVIGIIELIYFFKNKEYLTLTKTIGVLLIAAIFAIAPNYARLSNLAKYNKHSIRGKSELTIANKDVKTTDGLDKDYINSWSSGITESMMLFVPNVKGGATGALKTNKKIFSKLSRQQKQTIGNWNQYWGNQPFNGSPNYIGAVLFFLFFLGLFLIRAKFKYGILFSVLLLVLLSFGGNLSFFTDLFIDYVPLYNKFRAPVSILAIVAILTTLFAIYTLYEVIKKPDILAEKRKTFLSKKPIPIYILSSAIFGVFIFLNIVFPQFLNSYISKVENAQIGSQIDNPQVLAMISTITDFRISMFRAELWRTLLFCVITFTFIFLYAKKKIKSIALISLISILAIVDLWGVGTRYVNHDSFTKKNLVAQKYKLSPVDKQIYQSEIHQNPEIRQKLTDAIERISPRNETEREAIQTFVINKNSHYRVFNLAASPFNENSTANAHKSIGGYIAYKLRRYQDMIEHHISKNNIGVLNMLNTKYFITKQGLQQNPDAMGAAWFVDSVYWAQNANDEILSLNNIDVRNTVAVNIIDKEKVTDFSGKTITDNIKLVSYHPEKMIYETETSGNRLSVFSEIYYPDWEAFVDGKEVSIFTCNYILRGIIVPEGKHNIEFVFNPRFFNWTNRVSQFAYYLFLISIFCAVGWLVYSACTKTTEI